MNRKQGKALATAKKNEEVCKEFVRLYYGILNSHPHLLYHFYKEESSVVISEFGKEAIATTESANSQQSIRQLLTRVFKGIACKIKTAIPQVTVDGGLLLLVSGTMTKSESSSKENNEHFFTQALVLAPQKNGYYVLNDTLHIMGCFGDTSGTSKGLRNDEEICGRFYPNLHSSNSMVPVTPRPGYSPAPMNNRESDTSDDDGEIKSDSDSYTSSAPTRSQKHQSGVIQMGNTNRLPATPIYSASINGNGKIVGVRVGVPSGQSFNSTTRMPHPKKDEAQLPPVLPGHGVFIARLPFGINAEQVEQSFAQFGPILNGANGIQVRDGRNGCYAFVTFESSQSAQAAIDKGAVVQGKRVYVEPRLPRNSDDRSNVQPPSQSPSNAAITSPAASVGVPQ